MRWEKIRRLDSPTLSSRTRAVLGKNFPISVNCFAVSKFYFCDTVFGFVTANQMLEFVSNNFNQLRKPSDISLILIWSRSEFILPQGQIDLKKLAKKEAGFPFGLILEHSLVKINSVDVFQKADPGPKSPIEIIDFKLAIEPYLSKPRFEVTFHIPKWHMPFSLIIKQFPIRLAARALRSRKALEQKFI